MNKSLIIQKYKYLYKHVIYIPFFILLSMCIKAYNNSILTTKMRNTRKYILIFILYIFFF